MFSSFSFLNECHPVGHLASFRTVYLRNRICMELSRHMYGTASFFSVVAVVSASLNGYIIIYFSVPSLMKIQFINPNSATVNHLICILFCTCVIYLQDKFLDMKLLGQKLLCFYILIRFCQIAIHRGCINYTLTKNYDNYSNYQKNK